MKELAAIDLLLASTLRGNCAELPPELPAAEVLKRTEHHGIIPLLGHLHKQQEVLNDWPPAVVEQIHAFTRQAAAGEMLLEDELRNCLEKLAAASIGVLLTKGSLLAYRDYSAPFLRPRCDTDLFIAVDQKQQCATVLEQLGYQQSTAVDGDLIHQQAIWVRTLRHGISHSFDVHWHLFNRHILNDVLPFEICWAGRVQVPELGEHAYGLRPAHALLHACLHRLAHHGDSDRLIWLYDLYLLCKSMDDAERIEFTRAARDYRVAGACASSLHACETVLPHPTITALARTLDDDPGPADWSVDMIAATRPMEILRQDLDVLPTLTKKTRLLWQHAFPSSSYMRARYQVRYGAALPWYYLKRLYTGALKLNRSRSVQQH